MNIVEIIQKDEPEFTGICFRQINMSPEKVREFGISMAWTFNKYRAERCKKVLIAGHGEHKGKYFIADIVKPILSVREAYVLGKWKEAFDYDNALSDDWINNELKSNKENNPLDKRHVIVFENPTEIRCFSEKFSFSRGNFYYIHTKNSQKQDDKKQEDITTAERISLQAIGKVGSADIKMQGLTVIAGENNTGKSTIGKTLFSIIKGICLHNADTAHQNNQLLSEKMDKLYFRLRQVYDFSQNSQNAPSFKSMEFLKEIQGKSPSELNSIFQKRQEFIAKLNGNTAAESRQILAEIEKLAGQKDSQKALKKSLEKVFLREFKGEISPKNRKAKSIIEYTSGVSNILNIVIEDNRITEIDLKDELMFSDVVYIETPLFLQLYQLVKAANISHLALHITDLMEKIEQAKYVEKLFDEEENPIVKQMTDIMKGEFVFDEAKGDFDFKQAEGISIKPTNIASGIKSFGIIQLLKQAKILDDGTLLIIDEPENHLHPKWQVQYARILVELASEMTIIINSHSPYMIQALKYYSSENEYVKSKTSFYFIENEQVREVTHDLTPIFETLAAPLHQLVWTAQNNS